MDKCAVLLHIIEAYAAIIILFSRGGKFRGRKISRNSIRSGYYFRGRKISRKIKIREYSENFIHAKNWCEIPYMYDTLAYRRYNDTKWGLTEAFM